MTDDLLILLAVLAATAAVAWWWRRRNGVVRAGHAGERLTPDDYATLGIRPGNVVLLEFTAPGCVPCRATLRVLEELSSKRDDVEVAVVDVGEHLALARAHGVLRAPTTLVVDHDGVVRHRISGVPEPDDVAAVIDPPRGVRAG